MTLEPFESAVFVEGHSISTLKAGLKVALEYCR